MSCPASFENAIWLIEYRYKKCVRCTDVKCNSCQKKIDGEVLLLAEISDDEIKIILQAMNILKVPSFSEALIFSDISCGFEIFNERRLKYLESKFQIHINFYK